MTFNIKLVALIAASAVYAGPTQATALLNWDQSQAIVSTGTLKFDGVRLAGSGISFDLMQASGTIADGIYHCSNAGGTVTAGVTRCLLSFETGPLVTVAGPLYIFGPGGSIQLTGFLSTALPGDTAPVISGNPLVLSGQFNGEFTFTRGLSGLAQGFGVDIKDATLAEYFGLEQRFRFATSQIALTGCTSGETFNCQVTQADFQNTPLPEPTSLAMLGLGLIGIGLVRRRA